MAGNAGALRRLGFKAQLLKTVTKMIRKKMFKICTSAQLA